MADYIAKNLREEVYKRASWRCEYCQTDQGITGGQMTIDHIIPTARDGQSVLSNLCFACGWCNSFKSDKITGIDPLTGVEMPIFNPREQIWNKHFEWGSDGIFVIGRTPTGRATVDALKMNNEYIIPARRRWVSVGWHPPDEGPI